MMSTPFLSPHRSPPARARRPLAALLAAMLTAAIAAGCGGNGKPIPADRAAGLIAQLDEVLARVDAGRCRDVERGTLKRIDKRVNALPDDVDADVRSQIEEGVENLNDLVATECRQREPEEPEQTQPEETAPPPPTTPPPTETEPEQTEPEQTKPEKPKKPDDGGGGGGGGGDDGGGGGGGGGIEAGPGSNGGKDKKPKVKEE